MTMPSLTDSAVADLNAWLVRQGVEGTPRARMLEGYCLKLVGLGVPLMRMHVTMSALHPVYGGVGFSWRPDDGPEHLEYAHTQDVPDDWLSSPFYHMLTSGLGTYREVLWQSEAPSRFPLLRSVKAQGATDYIALGVLFDAPVPEQGLSIGDDPNGAYMSWIADAPQGFSDDHIALIHETFPTLSLVLKSGAHRKTAEDLLGVYLGRDAGQRVLSGEIQRGSTRWINAVICYADFEGFTSLSHQMEGEALIAMLNDYFAGIVREIEAEGGNVLKFMGDGLLAIFDQDQFDDAADRALRAVRAMGADIAAVSRRRRGQGAPVFGHTVALHTGPVLYGNIGAEERLDFTVIGPEVNLAARIGGMHKSLGQRVILSGKLAAEVTDPDFDLVSLGRVMLRGVDTPQELFTIYDPPQPTDGS
jgi:adenylate cyclase